MTIPLEDNPDVGDGSCKPKRRRAFHKKSRQGCKTCKCEGYKDNPNTNKSTPPSTGSLIPPPKLLIPRKNPDEIRSYNYFLEVTGPALSGLFDADFWCRELPKVCVADPALWHAVVALGSVHEACGYGDRTPETKPQYTLCLQQYSAAIATLNEPGSHRAADRWRAVIASTIFTCICVIQGLYKQALVIHTAAGCKLIREMEIEEDANRPQPITRDQHDTISAAPINLRQVKDLLFDFEMLSHSFASGGYSDDQNAATLSRTDSFGYWRFYKSPEISEATSRHLTPGFLFRARRAAESLQNGLVMWWQENRHEIHKLYGSEGVKECYEKLLARQAAHVRSYMELQKALRKFTTYLDLRDHALERSILELVQSTNSLYLLADPALPDPISRRAKMPLIADRIIDLSEKILASSSPSSGKLGLTPSTITSGSLSLVAQTGFSLQSRKRAMELLRRPRLEGFWEPALSASLAEAMWTREAELLDLWKQVESGGECIPIEERPYGYVDEETPLQFRVCSVKLDFLDKKREAVVTLMTQMYEQNGIEPAQRTITW
ncbi:Transcriptional regulatory protein-like protein [Fusarium austroafricanum]|uniref:Transcriptional regulatory protein-like protein n=1 Tax=Fusarium austroafricanum TaxID=2364996 RepID=A0A8H4NT14_9HYPO|nr:Transcriptional regulatory protein-like protein [Fusarium austroafricanum]